MIEFIISNITLIDIILLIILAAMSVFFVLNVKKSKTISKQASVLFAIYNSTPEAVFCKDINGFYINCNRNFENLAGVKESFIIGKRPSALNNFDDEAAIEMIEMDEKVINEGITMTSEKRIKTPYGEGNKIVEITKTPLMQNGKVTGLLGIARDITERKRYAKMVEELNNSLNIFVSYSDESLKEVMANGIIPIADAIKADRVCVYRNKNLKINQEGRPADDFYNSSTRRVCAEKNESKQLRMAYLWDRNCGGSARFDDKFIDNKEGQSSADFYNSSFLPDTQASERWTELLLKGETINKRVCDMSGDEAEFLNSLGIKVIVMVPIFSNNVLWGMVALENRTDGEYFKSGTAEANIMEVAARLIAKAIMRIETAENARLMLDAGPLCCQLWDENLNIIDCNEAAVRFYGFENKDEHIKRWVKECTPEYQPDGSLSMEKAAFFMKKAFEEGRCVFEWTNQLPDGTPLPSEITLVRVGQGENSIVAGYTRDLREIKNLEEMAEEIYYDSLTGIYNRRYLDKELNNIIKSTARTGASLSLLMIDIDHFKKYNDTYGHSEGDKCLKAVADILSGSVTRDTDFAVRYGGEEFTVVLPYTNDKGACLIAERIIENIRDAKIPHRESDAAEYVTVSVGIVTGKINHKQSCEDYIRQADEMLYKSKNNGRNMYSFRFFQ